VGYPSRPKRQPSPEEAREPAPEQQPVKKKKEDNPLLMKTGTYECGL